MDLSPGIVTALESRLAGHDGAHLAAGLRAQLARAQTRLEQRLREGLPPDRFAMTFACVDALRAARAVLATQPGDGPPQPRAAHHPLLSPLTSSAN